MSLIKRLEYDYENKEVRFYMSDDFYEFFCLTEDMIKDTCKMLNSKFVKSVKDFKPILIFNPSGRATNMEVEGVLFLVLL